MAENGETNTDTIDGETAELAEEIAEEIVEEIAEENPPDTDVDVTVIEAPEPPEPEPPAAKFAEVNVGDLHISGPADMVEKVTERYLKDHIDHNPHGIAEGATEALDEGVEAVTPDFVEEQIQEGVKDEISDAPPEPTDWLFRRRGGR